MIKKPVEEKKKLINAIELKRGFNLMKLNWNIRVAITQGFILNILDLYKSKYVSKSFESHKFQ